MTCFTHHLVAALAPNYKQHFYRLLNFESIVICQDFGSVAIVT
jgi:hypothetical protein